MDWHLAHLKEQVLVAEIGLEDLQLAQWQEHEPQVELQLAQGCQSIDEKLKPNITNHFRRSIWKCRQKPACSIVLS